MPPRRRLRDDYDDGRLTDLASAIALLIDDLDDENDNDDDDEWVLLLALEEAYNQERDRVLRQHEHLRVPQFEKHRPYKYLKARNLFREYTDQQFFEKFRFTKEHVYRLERALDMPVEIRSPCCGSRMLGIEALMVVLARHAYPSKWSQLRDMFGVCGSKLSGICNATLRWIDRRWCERILDHVDVDRVVPKLQEFADAIHAKCGVRNIAAFVDGTVRRFCRPGGDDANQRSQYSGHKRWHGFNYEGLLTPDGIIIRLIGPYDGRRHDMYMIRDGKLIELLHRWFGPYFVYGDLGYPMVGNLLVGWKGANLSAQQKAFNTRVSKCRMSVEHGFGKWITQFAFINFHANLKTQLQIVGTIHRVTALLTNCHTCLYGHQTATFYDVRPPTLEEYLSDFDPAPHVAAGTPV